MNFFLHLHFSMACTYEKSHTHGMRGVYMAVCSRRHAHTHGSLNFFVFTFSPVIFRFLRDFFRYFAAFHIRDFHLIFGNLSTFATTAFSFINFFFAVGAQTNELFANLHSFNVFYLRFSITLHFGLILNCF